MTFDHVLGAPIIVSLPHFYLADREYQTGVAGLSPTKEKHEIISIFDPVSDFLLCNKKTRLGVNTGPFPWLGL
jgi:hypothetical protein